MVCIQYRPPHIIINVQSPMASSISSREYQAIVDASVLERQKTRRISAVSRTRSKQRYTDRNTATVASSSSSCHASASFLGFSIEAPIETVHTSFCKSEMGWPYRRIKSRIVDEGCLSKEIC